MKRIVFLILLLSFLESSAQISNTVLKTSACGLSYIHKSIKITRRFEPPAGHATPAEFTISELPKTCYAIDHAYLWWTVSYMDGSPSNPRVRITKPGNDFDNYYAFQTGIGGQKCWEETGTRGFRVDIARSIDGNGKYTVEVETPDWETDGLTLLIIYRDLASEEEGHIALYDGLITKTGGKTSISIPGISFCGDHYSEKVFLIFSDVQGGEDFKVDLLVNNKNTNTRRLFWNSEIISTTTIPLAGSIPIEISPGNDCYSILMMGHYYKTNQCRSCTSDLKISARASQSSICSGKSVQLSVAGVDSCQWSSIPPGFYSVSKYPLVKPLQTTDYIVKGFSKDGCSRAYDTVRVTVTLTNMANAGEDLSICRGDSVFIGSEASEGTPPFSYSWSPAEGLTDSKSARTIASPTSTRRYILTVRDAEGCEDLDTVLVRVFNVPEIKAGTDTTICYGDGVRIGSRAKYGSEPYEYIWSPSAGLSANNIAQPLARPDSTTGYIVRVIDNNGCSSSDTIIVTVLPRIFTEAGNDVQICRGGSASLKASITGGEPPYSTEWSPKIGLDDYTGLTPKAHPGTTTTYYFTVTDGRGCMSLDSVKVVVNPLPEVDAGENAVICSGESVLLNARILSGTPPYNYKWEPAEGLSSEMDSAVTASPIVSTLYLIHLSDANGCTDFDSVLVTVQPVPHVKIIAEGSIALCNGESVKLRAESDLGQVTYEWSTGETGSEIVVAMPGTYSVVATSANSCTDRDSIEIKAAKIADVKIIGKTRLCTGSTEQLTVEGDYTTYLWSTGETNKSISISSPGIYFVEVSDSNGCSGADTLEVLASESKLLISPTGALVFNRIKAFTNETREISIYNPGKDTVVAALKVKNGSVPFALAGNPSYISINPNDSSQVSVTFSPRNIGQFNDTLIVETINPCTRTYMLSLNGEAYIESVLRLPYLKGLVGEPDFKIPLLAELLTDLPQNNLSYTADISYDSRFFLIDSLSSGTILENRIVDNRQYLSITDSNISIRMDRKPINELHGSLLLADSLKTPLYLDGFSWHNLYIDVIRIDGSLEIEGVCRSLVSAVKSFRPASLSVLPNPSDSRSIISFETDFAEDCYAELKIISSFGNIVETIFSSNLPKGPRSFKSLLGRDYAPGLYYARLVICGSETIVTPFIIAR